MKILCTLWCLLLSFSGWTQPLTPDMDLFSAMQPRNIGPAGMSGRVTDIEVVLKDPDVIYIGTAAGGIWRSENAGYTWTPIFDEATTASIGDIAIYQANPNIIYVGTGEGNPRNSHNSGTGMYKSIDGGRTWQHIGLDRTRQIHRVIVHPTNPDVVWAGSSGSTWAPNRERGVYKSTDGGKTWRKVLYLDDLTGVADLRSDPQNPEKLICAMWEHQRLPWFFTSGGKNGGIYISYDGGERWERVGCEHGLPCSDLGRIGLAFAPSNHQYVYAFVESKDNAIYRSTDGGHSWERRSRKGDRLIGDRPFYYADLYVDVRNENRVYSIATAVTVSEDGGVTWSTFAPGNRIHTDHHAWWGHPDDPEHLINGNDGGLFITHDRGANWFFAENLPLAQFYHIRVDNEVPYNVYGGLQDNGSWRGPSRTWWKGGIRNMYWQRLSVGDGFDVVPDPENADYGYAMGQAGNLVRYHCPSGQLQRIKPIHPTGEYLRFNWNAGIAVDPIDKRTLYYGSQYLHRSRDYGQSWEIISPDLTTNDPEKQQFLESGGLTYDVTGAEFHTTILAIAPSPLEQGVIWVGTDDGNVQVTRDGGATWKLCNDGIKGIPATTWVPHIHASSHRAGEALVVFDDHRRNNWIPYVYRTTDYGKSWTRIVDEDDVEGFAYVAIQDPVQPDLMFCGTDVGLFVSFDNGTTWDRWRHGYPTTPTRDLVVHPRDGDLVIGTFGRAIWILDDIGPLRQIAAEPELLAKPLYAFAAPDAILAIVGESHGYRDGKVGEVLYNGENRPYGALLSCYLQAVEGDQDTIDIVITDDQGNVVRHLAHIATSAGVQRLDWDLSRDAPRAPNVSRPDGPRYYRGKAVLPGTYSISFSCQGHHAETRVTVLPDPRLKRSMEEMTAKDQVIRQHYAQVEAMTAIADEIRSIEKALDWLKHRAGEQEVDLTKELKQFAPSLKAMKEQLLGREVQGIYRQPDVIVSILGQTEYLLDGVLQPFSHNQALQLEQQAQACARFTRDWQQFLNEHLAPFRESVLAKGVSLF
ncbi:MAG: hypothetical protein R3301_01485 [Saprospiraceae bacterium]|nr:hypothetical protein [Saprospiraceae bacterium]